MPEIEGSGAARAPGDNIPARGDQRKPAKGATRGRRRSPHAENEVFDQSPIVALLLGASALSGAAEPTHVENRSRYVAPHASAAPVIDGVADDEAWARASWRAIDQRWLGPEMSPGDFSGRFKVVWTEERLYLLGEFVDDALFDSHRDPLEQYWDDDCLEIFLDEDHSGGNHQFNHNAFAYHVSLDNRAIDIGTDEEARDYSHHVESRWRQQAGRIVWEVAIDVYTDSYVDDSDDNRPIRLAAGKIMDIQVLDHLIVADDASYSFAANGELPAYESV